MKETAKFKKECKEINAVSIQIKTNGPLIRWVRFTTFTRKFDYQRQTEDSLVKKYNHKTTFLNKNIPQLKKHGREEIYIKETVRLPLLGGSLTEIVPLHQEV